MDWGMDLIFEDVRNRPGQLDGVYTVSQPDAVGTYLKAGMDVVGTAEIPLGEGRGLHVFSVVVRKV